MQKFLSPKSKFKRLFQSASSANTNSGTEMLLPIPIQSQFFLLILTNPKASILPYKYLQNRQKKDQKKFTRNLRSKHHSNVKIPGAIQNTRNPISHHKSQHTSTHHRTTIRTSRHPVQSSNNHRRNPPYLQTRLQKNEEHMNVLESCKKREKRGFERRIGKEREIT